MKKLHLISFVIFTLLFISSGYAQNKISESFTPATFPPTGWRTQHVSGLIGPGDWVRSTTNYRTAPACAQSGSGILAENFLITKRITPSAGDSLVFYVASNYVGDALGRLDVKVSLTDSLAASFFDFLIPLQISLQLLTPNVYVRRAVSLDDYAGIPIYLAFRHIDLAGLGGAVRIDDANVGGVDLDLTVLIEAHRGIGMFPSPVRDRDTVKVSLRSVVSPFSVVQSRKVYLDTLGKKSINFSAGEDGIPYYIVVEHRNSVRTWSDSAGEVFTGAALTYDFTTGVNKAFRNNMKLVGGKACLYQGDLTQDGPINLTDLLIMYNDFVTFVVGPYVLSDLNWDQHPNLTDIILAYNNSVLFVAEKHP
ncbi:MAG: choice-of-anchor J domain-containing protein [Ignavibacteria bacterium]